MNSTINEIFIPQFGVSSNISSNSFQYQSGEKFPCATLHAPSGLEQYYCTAKDMNDVAAALKAINSYLYQGQQSSISVYTKQYINNNYYTQSDIDDILTGYYTKIDIDTNYYTKIDIDTNYYTQSYINKNYYTQSYIVANYYTKTNINDNYYNIDYINKNYFTRAQTISQIINAYKSQTISIPVDNISIKINAAGNLCVNLKSSNNLQTWDPNLSGVIHSFSNGINLLWDHTLIGKSINTLTDDEIVSLWGSIPENSLGKTNHYLSVHVDNKTLSSSFDSRYFHKLCPKSFPYKWRCFCS
jgi:hypothetical protein